MSASIHPTAIAAATIQSALFADRWLEELRRDPEPARRRGRSPATRAAQLAMFTERTIAGKVCFAFAVKRHFSGRARLPHGQLPNREEMRWMHELLVSVYADAPRPEPSCAEVESMAMFRAMEAE